jgi:YidC/Oxa1 family membrane protein insertase
VNSAAGSVLRFILLAVAGLLILNYFTGDKSQGESTPIAKEEQRTPDQRAPYQYCEIKTEHFRAQLTTRGATLKHFYLLAPKYQKNGEAHDVSTTPQPGAVPGTPAEEDPSTPGDHEFRQQLFVQFRNTTSPNVTGDMNWNMRWDSVDWTLSESDEKHCLFTYSDAEVKLEKLVVTTGRPYEVKVTSRITNNSGSDKMHATAIDTVAWWLDTDVEGKMFRVSPYVTRVECKTLGNSAVRLKPGDFDPDDMNSPEFGAAPGWYQASGTPAFVAVSNAYFSHALIPVDQDKKPVCQLQIERRGQGGPTPGAFYRARLAYPPRNLPPGQSAEYSTLSYIGPKERKVLAAAADGDHQLLEIIDLGFFAGIAKVLVSFLLKVYSVVPNWGIAIIVLTVTARVLLFPLSVPGIRTMIKMRELKPEMDELNKKYGDDARAKGVAQMELWRKHGMSPFDQVKGCLPQLATMPVWFALYTTLQTAVELYNIPFLWFPDLSEPDPYFVLPLIIGGTFFLQQKIAPFQGDPAQRKMMMYFMPGMFTVFMLFLPAGLGVYMFTNSLLAIVQQQAVEAHARRAQSSGSEERGQIVVSEGGGSDDLGGEDDRNRTRKKSRAKKGKHAS